MSVFSSSPSAEHEELDPRIQIELEKLNSATDEINTLETELDDANSAFRTLLNESTEQLKALAKKLGSCVEKSRPYHAAVEAYKKAQEECQRAAVQYHKAYEIHKAAKETITLAEQRFLSQKNEWKFDSAWQEMLNHATLKVTEAESLRRKSEQEHQRCAAHVAAAAHKVQEYEKNLKRSIMKSQPYFEQKEAFQAALVQQKNKIELLQRNVAKSKSSYANTLRSLESISEEIHEKRAALLPREPGVGAEKDSTPPPSLNFDLDRCDILSLTSTATTKPSSGSDDDSMSSTGPQAHSSTLEH